VRAWRQWRHARAQAAQWTERAGYLRGVLEKAIGSAPGGCVNGVPVISWEPTEKPHKFNQKKFKEDHPDLFAEYYELTEAPRPFCEVDFIPEDLESDDE
jgi:hypothetical protein